MKLIIKKWKIKNKRLFVCCHFFIFFIFIFSQQKNYCDPISDIVDCIVTGHDINIVDLRTKRKEKIKQEENFIKDFNGSLSLYFLCFDEALFSTNIINEFYLDTKLPSYMRDPAWKKLKTETDTYELFLLKIKMLILYLSGKNVKCDNLRYVKEMIASNSLLSITNNKYKHLCGFDFIMLLSLFLDDKVDHLDIREEEYNFVEKDMSTEIEKLKETLAPFFELFYKNCFVAQKYGIVYRSNYSKYYDYVGLTCPWLTFKNNSLVGKGFGHMLLDVVFYGVFFRIIYLLLIPAFILYTVKRGKRNHGEVPEEESSWSGIIIYFIIFFLVTFIFPFILEGRPVYVALSKKLKYIQDFIFGMEKIYNILKQCPLYYKLGSVLEYCKKIFEGEGLDDEQKELMGLLRSVPNNWSYWTWLTNNVKKISRLFILFEKLKDMFLPAFVEICRIDGYMSLFKLRNDESFMRHWSTPNFIESKRASLYIKDAFLPIMDPEKVVKNSICLGKRRKEEEGPCEEHDVELLVGMNAGGKTFFLETILANVLLSKVFGVTPAAEYESTDFDDVFYFSCGGSDIEGALSRYQVELKNVSELFEKVAKSPKGSRFLVLFDELFSSTDSASAKRMLIYTINRLAKSKKCLIVGATHVMDIDTIKKLFPDLKVKIYHMGVDVDDDGGVVFKYTKNEGMPKTAVAEELFKEKLGIDTLGF